MDKIGIIGMGVVGKAIHSFYIRRISTLWLYDKYKNIGTIKNIAENCRIIYVAVPTPYKKNVGFDLRELTDVLGLLECELKKLNKMCVVLLKSTILPGTSDKFSKRFPYLNIIYNPEFLSNSTAIEDFSNPKQIILGKTLISSNDVFKNIIKIHKKYWPGVLVTGTSAENAECTKIFLNNFYAVKIQFFNELWYLVKSLQINENYRVNYKEILKMMIDNGWLNPMHTRVPGSDGLLSYGGKCFPKDTNALLEMMKLNSPYYNVLKSVIEERRCIRNMDDF